MLTCQHCLTYASIPELVLIKTIFYFISRPAHVQTFYTRGVPIYNGQIQIFKSTKGYNAKPPHRG